MNTMNFQYNCPECKEKLHLAENKLHCNNCLCDYKCENNCAVFKNHNLSYISDNNQSVNELLAEIKHNKFEVAIKKFLISNQELSGVQISTITCFQRYDRYADKCILCSFRFKPKLIK